MNEGMSPVKTRAAVDVRWAPSSELGDRSSMHVAAAVPESVPTRRSWRRPLLGIPFGALGRAIREGDARAEVAGRDAVMRRTLAAADLTLIVTAHPSVDHRAIAERGGLVVDLRGVTRGTQAANVIRL